MRASGFPHGSIDKDRFASAESIERPGPRPNPNGAGFDYLGVTRNRPPGLGSSSIQSAPSGATPTSRVDVLAFRTAARRPGRRRRPDLPWSSWLPRVGRRCRSARPEHPCPVRRSPLSPRLFGPGPRSAPKHQRSRSGGRDERARPRRLHAIRDGAREGGSTSAGCPWCRRRSTGSGYSARRRIP